MERKMGRIESDVLRAKENAERMANSLLKKYPWMKSFRFIGDTSFTPNRSKKKIEKEVKEGKDVSFGLNMELSLLDMNNKEKRIEILFRFKEKPFFDVFFKSYKENPTIKDLRDQLKNTWMILGSGNTPEEPKAYVVAKIAEYPDICFTPQHDHGRIVKYRINFAKWSKWIPVEQVDLFGVKTIDEMMGRMRI
jgi:hypothetical protein